VRHLLTHLAFNGRNTNISIERKSMNNQTQQSTMSEDTSALAPKLPYTCPKITDYGDFVELTGAFQPQGGTDTFGEGFDPDNPS
jgi:hypothetical protein